MAKIPDFSHALSFLDKLNNVSVDGKNISSYFLWREYNLWHFYQSVLFRDIQKFDKNLSFDKEDNFSWRGFFSGFVLFLISILKILFSLFNNPKAFVYGIDKYSKPYGADPRMDDLYDYLKSNNVSYLEILHSFSGSDARRNLKLRKRGAVYVEAFDFLWSFLNLINFVENPQYSLIERVDLSAFTDESERKFAKKLLLRYMRLRSVSIMKMRWYERIFKIIKPRIMFLIDDGRYHYYELILAAKFSGVETVAIQHGQFNKYFLVGWLEENSFVGKYSFPDRYFLWSEYWKKELINFKTFIPKDNLIISGYPKKAIPPKTITNVNKSSDENLYVVLPYETSAPREQVQSYLRKIIDCRGVVLIFKLRPGSDPSSQIKEYLFSKQDENKIIVVNSMDDYFDKKVVAVGVYSTFLYEMILREIPVAILDTSFDHSEGMIRNKLADLIVRDDTMCDKLFELSSLPKEERERRRLVLGVDSNKKLYDAFVDVGLKYGFSKK
jgi:hypothetical protein